MQNPFPSLSGFSFLPHFRPLTTIVRLHFPEWYLFSHLSSFSLSFHTSSSKGFFQLQWQTDQRNGGCIGKGKFYFKLVANCPWKKSNSCPHIWSLLTGFWKTITRRYDLHFFSSRWQLCTFTSVCPYWKAEREKKKPRKTKQTSFARIWRNCALYILFAASGKGEQGQVRVCIWAFGSLLLLPVLGGWVTCACLQRCRAQQKCRVQLCLFQTN